MLTKETPLAIKALYDECMALFATTTLFNVFPGEITLVIDRQPDTDLHDIWFYCYKESPERIAYITAAGQTVHAVSETVIERLETTLSILPAVLMDQRNRLCEQETGVPWLVATGQANLPPTAHRKPTRERRH